MARSDAMRADGESGRWALWPIGSTSVARPARYPPGGRARRRTPRRSIAGGAAGTEAGFTLIETLVAFTILATVLAVLMQNLGTGIRHQRLSTLYLEALTVAESRLAEFGRLGTDVPTRIESPPDARFSWVVTFTPYLPPAADGAGDPRESAVDLYRVDVTVGWPDRGGEHRLVVSSLRAAPRPDR